jgi:gas vesicle protein
MREVSWKNLRGGQEYYIYNEELAREYPGVYSGKKIGTFDRIIYFMPSIDSVYGEWSYIPNDAEHLESQIFARFTNLRDVNGKIDSGMGSVTENDYSVESTTFYKASSSSLKEKVAKDIKEVEEARKTLLSDIIDSSIHDPHLAKEAKSYLGGKRRNRTRKNKTRKNKTNKRRTTV